MFTLYMIFVCCSRCGSVADLQDVTTRIWEIIVTWMKNSGLYHIMQSIKEHD